MFHPPRSSFLTSPNNDHPPRSRTSGPGVIPGEWLVAAAGLSFLALVALMVSARLTIDPFNRSTIPFGILGVVAAAARYALRHPTTQRERIGRDVSEFFGLFVLITLMGATATYPLSANSHGFVDRSLERIDASLRFDWIAWYNLVAAHRSLQLLGTFAYQSIFVTPAVLLGYFAWSGHRAEARAFIASFWLAAVISLILFRFIPAQGPLAFLWHRPIPYMPESALYQAQLIPELRHHLIQHVDLGQLRGLVSAPSFHTASAVLFIAAAWPFRRLRWPLIIVNVAMLLSTPVEGTHYLADMIAGALVAAAALCIVAELGRRLARISGNGMDDGNNDFPAGRHDPAAVPAG